MNCLPDSIAGLRQLAKPEVDYLREINSLAKLQTLDISGCQKVKALPSIKTLASLEELRAYKCVKLKSM